MTGPDQFLSGVIEGFYGRPWAFELRLEYAGHLARAGLNTCIYCPKSDPYLRRQWQQHWPDAEWRQLRRLSAAYRERGLLWGVGLSPYALYRDYRGNPRAKLKEKIATLSELEAPLLAVLFDDMPGDVEELASRQAEIVSDICHWSPGLRIVVCPTYYTFDPVLERHFGAMPGGYWEELGRELPSDVDVFWTGNQVCSKSVAAEDLRTINGILGRPVTLWDNYPVNDGPVRSNFLYCDPPPGRDPAIASLLRGHLSNPMNQGLLSLPALWGLAARYADSAPDERWLQQALGPATWRQLQLDREVFRTLGLSGLGTQRREELARCYDALPGAAAVEVADWLRGKYAFDPACLTD